MTKFRRTYGGHSYTLNVAPKVVKKLGKPTIEKVRADYVQVCFYKRGKRTGVRVIGR